MKKEYIYAVGGVFLIITLIILFVYFSRGSKSDVKKSTTESSGADTIIISNEGSRKETYIASPQAHCLSSDFSDSRPDWCNKYPGDNPMIYYYDSNTGFEDLYKSLFDNGGECVTSGCKKYTEILNETDNKLIDIRSEDGTSMIDQMGNDVYSGKIIVPDLFFKNVTFNFFTGETLAEGKRLVPGGNYPIALYILIIFIYYKKANLLKPNIKLDYISGPAKIIIQRADEELS